MKARVLVTATSLACAASLLTACGNAEQDARDARVAQVRAAVADRSAKVLAAARAGANEAGDVPVLMYHRIIEDAAVPEDRTPGQFRAELERLAREGYVPVTAAEYVTGRMDLPAGRHPVVLTFDDSSASQLTLDETGAPAPDTAAGIIREVAARHPGFRPVATFYVTRDMFQLAERGEQREALAWLGANGFEIGNHTRDHHDLAGKSKDQVAGQIVGGHSLITGLGGTAPRTLALPYGNRPRKDRWADRGSDAKTSYDYDGVFLAGYTPSPSPFARDFDPLALPRIRSGGTGGDCTQFCSKGWLDWFEQHPGERYTSDGSPDIVSVPEHKADEVAKERRAKLLSYSDIVSRK